MAKNNMVEYNQDEEIIDVDLSVIKKKKFRINKDGGKILELNVSDVNIAGRLEETLPKLQELQLQTGSDSDEIDMVVIESLKEIDGKMREYVDYIFNSNVSEVCASDGSMYDPINGTFRYEHIITVLLGLYEKNIAEETKKLNERLSKHTKKYTK